MKKQISIFRKVFKPTPQPEVTDVLMSQVHEQGKFPPLAIPTPFGVMSILTTTKSVDEVKSILAAQLPSHNFEVFEVPSDQQPSQPSSDDYSNATMDEILDLIGEVGGVQNLPQSAQQRLAQLRG